MNAIPDPNPGDACFSFASAISSAQLIQFDYSTGGDKGPLLFYLGMP